MLFEDDPEGFATAELVSALPRRYYGVADHDPRRERLLEESDGLSRCFKQRRLFGRQTPALRVVEVALGVRQTFLPRVKNSSFRGWKNSVPREDEGVHRVRCFCLET